MHDEGNKDQRSILKKIFCACKDFLTPREPRVIGSFNTIDIRLFVNCKLKKCEVIKMFNASFDGNCKMSITVNSITLDFHITEMRQPAFFSFGKKLYEDKELINKYEFKYSKGIRYFQDIAGPQDSPPSPV